MTEIKCNNCGGNQFKPNKEIAQFLECTHCGTQYKNKVKDIEVELPVNLKVKIKTDRSKLKINNCIIEGDWNKIKGNFNAIIGNRNKVDGKGNILIQGDWNKINNEEDD